MPNVKIGHRTSNFDVIDAFAHCVTFYVVKEALVLYISSCDMLGKEMADGLNEWLVVTS